MVVRKSVIAAVLFTQITLSSPGMGTLINCYECNGPNHFAKGCMKRQKTTCAHCYWCNKIGHLVRNCQRKQSWGYDVSIGLFPRQQVNLELPIITVYANSNPVWVLTVHLGRKVMLVLVKQDIAITTVTGVTHAKPPFVRD